MFYYTICIGVVIYKMFINKNQYRVLIVDDVVTNVQAINEILKDEYIVQVALSGNKALQLARDTNYPPDIILLDIIMPGLDGYEVCRQLKSDPVTREIPIIFFSSMDEVEDETYGLQLGASDYLSKPVNARICKVRVANQLKLKQARFLQKSQKALLEKLVNERTQELIQTQDVTIQCIASLAETRDNETGNHIVRTKLYVKTIAEELVRDGSYQDEIDTDLIDNLYKSAPLHDIGKVGIPDNILLKPGKLSFEEFEIMKKHTTLGASALIRAEKKLGQNSFLKTAREIALNHHEKWDGTGYPNGISGRDIPLSGRIMAIADVYDALISKRVYKPAFSHLKACEIIYDGSETHFDPILVECFRNVEKDIRFAAQESADSDEQIEVLDY